MTLLALQLQSIRAGLLTPVFGLLIDTALKGSLLIAAAAIAGYMLRGRSASARHAAWSAAVIGHLALPVLTLLAPQWRLPVLPAPPWLDVAMVIPATPSTISLPSTVINGPAESSAPAATVTVPSSSTVVGPNPESIDASIRIGAPATTASKNSSQPVWPIISLLGVFWILGTVFVLMRLAYGTWRVGKLAKNGNRVDDGEWLSLAQRLASRLNITRPLTLLRGESLAVPVTWGVVYPAVLLPPDADQWPEARRRFVLVHEMAHVKRFDALTQLLAQFAIAILWFDPLIWLAAHRMRVEREHACDDYVLRDGTAPSLYAGELLEMVQSIGSPRHESAAPAFAALAMARRSEFEGRMLAILDPKQERHTLGRRSAIAASIALALLVLPLAALRPFHNPSPSAARIMANGDSAKSDPYPAASLRKITDNTCDLVWASGQRKTSSHIHNDNSAEGSYVELFVTTDKSCSQAAIVGHASFLDDRLVALSKGSAASFHEITDDFDRKVVISPDNGVLRYAATLSGRPVAYDDAMRSWLGNFMPEVLRETGIDAAARVARDREQGGVSAVLRDIARIQSPASKREHYEALLRGQRLANAEYDRVARQAGRELASVPTDLDAVLTLMSATPTSGVRALERAVGKLAAAQQTMVDALGTALSENKSSTDSAATYKQYADTDDPEMIFMALRGVRVLSSDSDRRVLLQALAPRALGNRKSRLRVAFFDATSAFTSDSDMRIVLQDALVYATTDPAITLAAFKLVGKMTDDSDRRLVLTTAASQHLLNSREAREAYMTAAKKITSSSDYRIVMQAILQQ
ncbi:MAG: M56 family metallopeptidase [Gemmatimonadales bacterium]